MYLACYQDYSKIFWRVKIWLWCYGPDENRTSIPPALVKLFHGIFFQDTWHTLSNEAKEDALVVSAFPPFMYSDDDPSLPIFRRPSRTPGHLAHTSKPNNSFFCSRLLEFRTGFHHTLQLSHLSVFCQLRRVPLQ